MRTNMKPWLIAILLAFSLADRAPAVRAITFRQQPFLKTPAGEDLDEMCARRSYRSRVLSGWPDDFSLDLPGVGRRQDIAGGSFLLEMQPNATHIELRKHHFDPLFDGCVVGAAASGELFDNSL